MSRALCTAATGPAARWLEVAAPTFAAYATLHGYEFVQVTERLCESRPPSWDRIPLLSRLLQEHETVVWVDADCCFVDLEADIADRLVDGAFMAVNENVTDRGRVPNAGVMVLRAGEITQRFLREVWARVDRVEHPWWENAAMLDVLGFDHGFRADGKVAEVRLTRSTGFYDRVCELGTEFNSMFFNLPARPRIRHLAGLYPREARLRLLARDRELFEARYLPDGRRRNPHAPMADYDWPQAIALAQLGCQTLEGERVALRPAADEDLDRLAGWFADPDVYAFWHRRPLGRAEIAAKYTGRCPRRHPFIVNHADGTPIGYAQIFARAGGEAGVAMMLAPGWRDRGLGPDVMRTLVDALQRHGQRVRVTPMAGNMRAVAAWRKAGLRVASHTPAGEGSLVELVTGT